MKKVSEKCEACVEAEVKIEYILPDMRNEGYKDMYRGLVEDTRQLNCNCKPTKKGEDDE